MRWGGRAEVLPGLTGTARVDRRTSGVLARLGSGDIAVLNEPDLDQATARELIAAGVAAVIDLAPFVTGRMPNLGPELLDRAGVLLLQAGPEDAVALKDGARLRIHQGVVHSGERELFTGTVFDAEQIAVAAAAAREGLGRQLESFSHNASAYLRREERLLLHGDGLPGLAGKVADRPVLVVTDGPHRGEQLDLVAQFVREQRPYLVGVDEGAEELLRSRLRPDLAVVSDEYADRVDSEAVTRVLGHARQLVLHRPHGSSDRAGERLGRRGVAVSVVQSDATTADVALLLVHRHRPELIVEAGGGRTLEEFLDRGRNDQASAFLTRLRLGADLVDARAVPRLYSGRTRSWHLVAVVLAALVALWLAMATTPIGNVWWHAAGDLLDSVLTWLKGLFS